MKAGVWADGAGLASHAGSGLLAGLADRVGLTSALSRELAGLRERRGGHDAGRVIRDLAAMLADGDDCLPDLRAVMQCWQARDANVRVPGVAAVRVPTR